MQCSDVVLRSDSNVADDMKDEANVGCIDERP